LKVTWSTSAQRDLLRIVDYISSDDPAAAERVGQRMGEAVQSLAKMPRLGRPSRSKGGRELVLSPLPYIVEYIVREEQVFIRRIWHGAQRRP